MGGLSITAVKELEERINSVSNKKYKIIKENRKLQLVRVMNENDMSIISITPFLTSREMNYFINSLLTYLREEASKE